MSAKAGRTIDEHLATRRAAGLFDFSFMGLYEFPVEKDLGRLQSRDLRSLLPGQIAYTLLLNEDGSVFNDATVWKMGGERCWLFSGRRSDFERLRGAARDRSGEFAILALQGPASGAILARLVGTELVRSLGYFRFAQKEEILVARLGYSGELGYELLVPAAQAAALRQRLMQAGKGHGLIECGFEAADSLRIESGYVIFAREIDGRANPRELGLERLVFEKKDFPIARKLVGLVIEEQSMKGHAVTVSLTSECFSPALGKQIGLGFAPPDASGEARLADGRGARIASLPFYDPERRRPRAAPL